MLLYFQPSEYRELDHAGCVRGTYQHRSVVEAAVEPTVYRRHAAVLRGQTRGNGPDQVSWIVFLRGRRLSSQIRNKRAVNV